MDITLLKNESKCENGVGIYIRLVTDVVAFEAKQRRASFITARFQSSAEYSSRLLILPTANM